MSPDASWWELSLTVPAASADDLCGLLLFHGALGAELATRDLPAPDFIKPPLPLPTGQAGIRASFDPTLPETAVQSAAEQAFADLGCPLAECDPRLRRRDDTAWAEAWKSFFKPLSFGDRLWVIPRWDTEAENEATLLALPLTERSTVVHLEPGLAFGTGQHATTSLCLEVLLPLLGAPCERLLDVGCGSGILSIAAAALGVPCVVGTDNDPVAVRVARENVTANQVEHAVTIHEAPLPSTEAPFDVVMANIIAPVLIELAPTLVNALAPGATLLLSGILEPQWPGVQATFDQAAAEAGLPALRWGAPSTKEEWLAVTATL